ncbi:MAG: hypothetical protein H6978_01850 [Gammaproteobacteria bacterium]|nr:hypothetical protein [Gammaproteobacteria bacterium]
MYTRTPARSRTLALTLLASTLLTTTGVSANIVAFDFDTAEGGFELMPDMVAPGISSSLWSDTDGNLSNVSGNPGLAASARGFDDGNAMTFSLSLPTGVTLAISDVAFDQRASSSGPTGWALAINGVTVASGATTTTFGHILESVTLPSISGVADFVLSGLGAASASGTWRVDNFEVSGALMTQPVPVPAALVLLTSSIAGLVGLRGLGRV